MTEFDNARLVAGGQSLMPMLNMRLATPEHLIDLAGVEGLAYITEDGGEIAIGAMTAAAHDRVLGSHQTATAKETAFTAMAIYL